MTVLDSDRVLSKGIHLLWLVVVTPAILGLDLATKAAASRALDPRQGGADRWLWDDRLGLAYAQNSGVAFGLLKSAGAEVLSAAAVVLLTVLGWIVWVNRQRLLTVAGGGAVAAGAAGNLIDRLRFGHVRDFIVVGPWPAFNVADAAVTLGAVSLFVAFSGIAARGDEATEQGANTGSSRRALFGANE
jgi:signal peptidase II